VRIATFNLLHGLALSSGRPDSSTDAALLREAVAGLDADVLGLQEVDVHQPRSAMVHPVAGGRRGDGGGRFAPSVHGTPVSST
jgi:endonuclease/exonuclease/phosphatase family metal-dependent hydrolase